MWEACLERVPRPPSLAYSYIRGLLLPSPSTLYQALPEHNAITKATTLDRAYCPIGGDGQGRGSM